MYFPPIWLISIFSRVIFTFMLSDAEADNHYFNPDFGKGNVVTYTVTDTEIIQCRNMGDFKTGVAIPYTENLENLIKEFYKLNDEFWGE